MANGVCNIAKGRVNEYVARVAGNDPANCGLVLVLLKLAEADATLADYDNLAALLAGANTESTDGTYARGVLTDADVSEPTPDDAANSQSADIPDQIWSGMSGEELVKLLVCYDPDLTGGDDSSIVPLTYHDFVVTTDGNPINALIANAGFYTAT